ncbi:MAG: single-stranded DNA-binding protein, partial [Oscillospiraceae bacterium]
QTQSGLAVVSFSVACNRPYQKNGEKIADFINCVAWRNTAEFIGKYFKKGSSIGIEGSIQTKKYQDKDGNNRYQTNVLVSNVSFVGSNSKQNNNNSPSDDDAPPCDFTSGSIDDFEEVDGNIDLPF